MTKISLGSLTVLVISFFPSNIGAASSISPTIQNNELKTYSTVSMINVVTTEIGPGEIDNNTSETNHLRSNSNVNDKKNISLLEKFYCSNSSNKENCSTHLTKGPKTNIVTYRDFTEYILYKNVIAVTPYASNIPGIITNILTSLIATNIKPFHTSEIYMTVLGIADFVAVVSRCSYRLLRVYNDDINATICKVPQYTIYVSLIYSNIILMSWTIERFIAVIFPIQLAAWCSVRNTKITIFFLLIISLLLGLPYLTDVNDHSYWTGEVTVSVCIQSEFLNSFWTYTQSFYYVYIPVVCVCTCNIAIICRLRSMTKSRIDLASNQETINRKTRESRKMTILLLSVSICFLVLHIPYDAILVFYYFYPDPTVLISTDPHAFAKFIFYSALGSVVTEFQNSVNCFLYCISGSKFRTTLKRMFCKAFMYTKQAGTSLSHATRSTKF